MQGERKRSELGERTRTIDTVLAGKGTPNIREHNNKNDAVKRDKAVGELTRRVRESEREKKNNRQWKNTIKYTGRKGTSIKKKYKARRELKMYTQIRITDKEQRGKM